MQCSNGKVRAVVRSSRVPVGLITFTMPRFSSIGPLGSTPVRSAVYANVLDESQQRLLDHARRVAEASNLDLEVVDLGKQGLLQRIASRLRDMKSPSGEGIHLEVKSLPDIETAFNSSIR